MKVLKDKSGKIIEPPYCNIRDHERRSAQAIAVKGFVVEFVPDSRQDFTKSPDVLIDGVRWEIKSPKTSKIHQLQNNIKKANRQSQFIIIDSQRIKYIPDSKIKDYLVSRLKAQKSIKKLWFINRRRDVIDIGDFI